MNSLVSLVSTYAHESLPTGESEMPIFEIGAKCI